MARKLGDVAIALIILTFVVATFSSLINMGDDSEGVSSGVVGGGLSGLDNNLSGSSSFQASFSGSVDELDDIEADPNQQLETRGDKAGSLLNLLNKNLFVKFFNAISNEFPQGSMVIGLLLSLIGVSITILLLRFWRGEGKI